MNDGPYRHADLEEPPRPRKLWPWLVASTLISAAASGGLAWYLAPETVEVTPECPPPSFHDAAETCLHLCGGSEGVAFYAREQGYGDHMCQCKGSPELPPSAFNDFW